MLPDLSGPGPGVHGLLDAGSARGLELAGDQAVLNAMVRAEVAWAHVLADGGWAPSDLPRILTETVNGSPPDLSDLVARCADGGNPVIPLVAALRQGMGEGHLAEQVHRGLTSQDVLDTALILVSRQVLQRLAHQLDQIGDRLVALVEEHAETVMVGRTLTQHAVPITFGLKAAQWLAGVTAADADVGSCLGGLPVQCGGAAGTFAGALVVSGGAGGSGKPGRPGAVDPQLLASRFAAALGLDWPGAPWHTRRRPITGIGDTLAAVVDVLGHLGTDLALLARPEVGEVLPVASPGRGGSSAMPHKNNPVAAILLRSAGIQAGPLAGLLHQCAALAVDERSDGAWHAEWPVLQRLCVLAVTAGDQAMDLVTRLEVRGDRIAEHVAGSAPELLSEWRDLARSGPNNRPVPEGAGPADYTGAAQVTAADVVGRWRDRRS